MHLLVVLVAMGVSNSLAYSCSPHFAVSPPSGWIFTHNSTYPVNVTFPAGTKIVLPGSNLQVPIENATSTQLATFFNTSQPFHGNDVQYPISLVMVNATLIWYAPILTATRINATSISLLAQLNTKSAEYQVTVGSTHFIWPGASLVPSFTAAVYTGASSVNSNFTLSTCSRDTSVLYARAIAQMCPSNTSASNNNTFPTSFPLGNTTTASITHFEAAITSNSSGTVLYVSPDCCCCCCCAYMFQVDFIAAFGDDVTANATLNLSYGHFAVGADEYQVDDVGNITVSFTGMRAVRVSALI